ncbi:MAG: hypothetical protein RBS17_11500 [Coriobacteriia bacterium]|nr:hypothetical protein [Coriobacteriia bacterium]
MGLHEFVALTFEFVTLSAEVVEFRLRGLSRCTKFFGEQSLDGLAQLRVERHVAVALLDALLDVLNQDRLEVAARAVALSAEADEVRVQLAGLGLGHRDPKAGAADAAVHRALEEVGVLPCLLTLEVRLKGVLDELPRSFVDQGLVLTGVIHTLELDQALVVGIDEDLVEALLVDRLRRDAGSRQGRKTAIAEVLCKRRQCPVASGIELERFSDEPSTL